MRWVVRSTLGQHWENIGLMVSCKQAQGEEAPRLWQIFIWSSRVPPRCLGTPWASTNNHWVFTQRHSMRREASYWNMTLPSFTLTCLAFDPPPNWLNTCFRAQIYHLLQKANRLEPQTILGLAIVHLSVRVFPQYSSLSLVIALLFCCKLLLFSPTTLIEMKGWHQQAAPFRMKSRGCRRNIDIDGKHCSHGRSCTFPIITRLGIVANCRHYSRAPTSARLFSC